MNKPTNVTPTIACAVLFALFLFASIFTGFYVVSKQNRARQEAHEAKLLRQFFSLAQPRPASIMDARQVEGERVHDPQEKEKDAEMVRRLRQSAQERQGFSERLPR